MLNYVCPCTAEAMWKVGFDNPCFRNVAKPQTLQERIAWADSHLKVRIRLNEYLRATNRNESANQRLEDLWEQNVLNLYQLKEDENA